MGQVKVTKPIATNRPVTIYQSAVFVRVSVRTAVITAIPKPVVTEAVILAVGAVTRSMAAAALAGIAVVVVIIVVAVAIVVVAAARATA
jgi:hypothetical protein